MTNSTPVYGWQYANLSTDPLTYPVVSGETFLRAIEATVSGVDTRLAAAEAGLAAAVAETLALRPIVAMKSTSTPISNDATVNADPHLSISLPGGFTYDIDSKLYVTSDANAAGDFLCQFSWTGTAAVTAAIDGLHNNLASGSLADMEGAAFFDDSSSPSAPFVIGASTSPTGGRIYGHVVASTTTVLTLEWAQFASNASATNLLKGSTLMARRR